MAWQGSPDVSVGETEEFFAKACFDSDKRTGDPADCRWFLNWYDDEPRGKVFRELLVEVTRALVALDYVEEHGEPLPCGPEPDYFK